MFEKREGNLVYRHFKSVKEALTEPLTRNHDVDRHIRECVAPSRISWWGVDGGAEAVERVLRTGWPEGLKLLHQHQSEVKLPPQKATKRKRVRADQGDELSIDSVYAGRLETAWTRRAPVVEHGSKRGQFLTVVVGVGALSKVRQSQAIWRGIAAMKIVEHATSLGMHVRVLTEATAQGANGRNRITCNTVLIKDYRQRLLPDLLMAVTGLAGYHRVVNFRARCLGDLEASKSMGSTCSFPSEVLQMSGVQKPGETVLHVPANTLSQRAAERLLQNLPT